MARARNKLNARTVENLKDAGRYSDGGGLHLAVDDTNRSRWIYLFNFAGRRREMGLGGYPQVSLKDARKAGDDAEQAVLNGQDPIEARISAKAEREDKIPTFGEMADKVVDAKLTQWRNEKHKWQWRHTLTVYASELRDVPVNEITTAHVLAVLQPLWESKQETASRLRGRIEAVLDAAKALISRIDTFGCPSLKRSKAVSTHIATSPS